MAYCVVSYESLKYILLSMVLRITIAPTVKGPKQLNIFGVYLTDIDIMNIN